MVFSLYVETYVFVFDPESPYILLAMPCLDGIRWSFTLISYCECIVCQEAKGTGPIAGPPTLSLLP